MTAPVPTTWGVPRRVATLRAVAQLRRHTTAVLTEAIASATTPVQRAQVLEASHYVTAGLSGIRNALASEESR